MSIIKALAMQSIKESISTALEAADPPAELLALVNALKSQGISQRQMVTEFLDHLAALPQETEHDSRKFDDLGDVLDIIVGRLFPDGMSRQEMREFFDERQRERLRGG